MKFRSAFSLLEIITVVVIIGALAALATTSLKSATLKARDGRRVSDINAMRKALEIYKVNNEVYPTEAQFILGAPFKIGNDTLIQKLPFNPKVADGPCAINEYLYRQDNGGASYHIFYCLGQKVNDAGPGPCIATPGHHCANCTGGSCANKCGGDDGCGQPCPTATCSYPRPFCEVSTGNCICRNNSDCNAGQFCSIAGVCVNNGTCAHNNDCGTCMKCSAQGIQGTCIAQSNTEDLKDECSTNNCFTGNCKTGGGSCEIYSDNQPHNCDLTGNYENRKCNGAASGLCNCISSACGGTTGVAPGFSNGCGGVCNTACAANTCVNATTGRCEAKVPVVSETQISVLLQSDACNTCGLWKNANYGICATNNAALVGCACCPHGCADLAIGSTPRCRTTCQALVAQNYDDWEWRGEISGYLNGGQYSSDNDINNFGTKTCADNSQTASANPPAYGIRGWQSCTCVRYSWQCP